MYPNESDIILQDEHSCVVKLQRNPKDQFCSLQFAKKTGDWGVNPSNHQRNAKQKKLKETRSDVNCDEMISQKKDDFRQSVINHMRWFKNGEAFYDVEVSFDEHVESYER